MNVVFTPIKDLLVLEPKIFFDNRGYFFESFSQKQFEDNGLNYTFVQDNESKSEYGVVRGLHFQKAPYSQSKLVRVIEGTVYDVAVDLRKSSPTYGQWFGVELSGENKKQFLIPKGFAHGFSVLSEEVVFAYKCDELYHPESEGGIAFDDPALGIDWKVDLQKIKVSDKDRRNPRLENSDYNFI